MRKAFQNVQWSLTPSLSMPQQRVCIHLFQFLIFKNPPRFYCPVLFLTFLRVQRNKCNCHSAHLRERKTRNYDLRVRCWDNLRKLGLRKCYAWHRCVVGFKGFWIFFGLWLDFPVFDFFFGLRLVFGLVRWFLIFFGLWLDFPVFGFFFGLWLVFVRRERYLRGEWKFKFLPH